jgi:alpha-galactosidase
MKTKGSYWRAYSCLLLSILCAISAFARSSAQEAQVAPIPPMGWNSWGGAECDDTDAFVRSQADLMVSNGMKAAGYQYVNLDACWQGPRDPQGRIRGNERFPDMKALADYVHSKGLRFGVGTLRKSYNCILP